MQDKKFDVEVMTVSCILSSSWKHAWNLCRTVTASYSFGECGLRIEDFAIEGSGSKHGIEPGRSDQALCHEFHGFSNTSAELRGEPNARAVVHLTVCSQQWRTKLRSQRGPSVGSSAGHGKLGSKLAPMQMASA